MINVLEPQNEVLRQFVDSIYVFKRNPDKFEFTAYPSANTPVALFRNATVNIKNEKIQIKSADVPNHFAIACNQFFTSAHLQYLQMVDEIAINFKPLGYSSFTGSKPQPTKIFALYNWDELLPGLFDALFETDDPKQQLHCIEDFLLAQYQALADESILLKAIELLSDTARDYKIQEVAEQVGIHYKQLYRKFTENVGCNPMHYRKLMKFRSSVVSKLKQGDNVRLVDITYDHDYTDQSYFIKQFRALTGKRPIHFFSEITSFGNEKVIFKID